MAGGAVPLHGQDVVLDLSKLTKIISFDRERKSVEVEAGIILDELNEFLEKYNLEFPVNPSSHSICTIGGMIATDAVGSRAVKYGRTSRWINWIEVIDCKGNLVKKGTTEINDYSGMEGITGVIVKASLRLAEKKQRTASLILKDDFREILLAVKELKRNGSVSMIEFLDKQIAEWLGLGKMYVLIVEYESSEGEFSGNEYLRLMETRDRIYPVLGEKGFTRIEDPKIMTDKSSDLLEWLERKGVPVFGHISIGIFHPCFNKEQEKYIPEMMKIVKRMSGQVSGEHGIGILKREFVDANDRKILVNIKKRSDLMDKFNSGKVL